MAEVVVFLLACAFVTEMTGTRGLAELIALNIV